MKSAKAGENSQMVKVHKCSHSYDKVLKYQNSLYIMYFGFNNLLIKNLQKENIFVTFIAFMQSNLNISNLYNQISQQKTTTLLYKTVKG